MKENKFENLDPTAPLRNELADALADLAKNEEEKKILARFRRGFFFLPSDTTNGMSKLL